MELMLTPLTSLLLFLLFVLLFMLFTVILKVRPENQKNNKSCSVLLSPPGPCILPFLGNLITVLLYRDIHECFASMRKKYGDIFSLSLGKQRCIVVSSYAAIREVLITRGNSFGGRPNFLRYHRLFGGRRDNSLALCDWSDLQRTRRKIAHSYLYPKFASYKEKILENIIITEIDCLLDKIKTTDYQITKFLLLRTCANIFFDYLCSVKFDFEDEEFVKMVKEFDLIFYDINQGYALDFFPYLSFFYSNHLKQLETWSKSIRHFILERVIKSHYQTFDEENKRDIVDDLIESADREAGGINWESALFQLEDLIGGSSAVANFWMQVLFKISSHSHVMQAIQEEISDVTNDRRRVMLEDRPRLPYTEATLLECLRTISSPIVPHVSMENTQISGYFVPVDTMIIIDNYDLNHNPKLWTNPEIFDPSRFIKHGKVVRPDFFIPFSTGKRACMGHRLVLNISFLGITRFLQEGNLSIVGDPNIFCLQENSLALPFSTFSLNFFEKKRKDLPVI